jgi:Undecaprenyl-phosphate glucose phosphotransferase
MEPRRRRRVGMSTLTRLQTQRRAANRRLVGFVWRTFSAVVALAEFVLIASTSVLCGIAYHLFAYEGPGEVLAYLTIGSVVALIFVSTNAFWGDYNIREYISVSSRIRRPFTAWNVAFLYTLALSFAAKIGAEFSRGSVVLLYVAGIVVLMLWRAWLVHVVVFASKTGQIAARRVLLVGEREAIQEFAKRYQPWNLGFEIVGEAVLQSPAMLDRDLERAAVAGRALHPDDVFILMPWSQTEIIERVVDKLLTVPVSIHLGPERILDRYARVQIVKVSSMATMCLVRPPLSGLGVLTKRTFDFVASAVGLLVLLPFFALVAVLVKLDSPGPVFFRQQRYGFNQRPFWIFKFRTMAVHDDRSVRQATREDERVTRLGRHLRRWNVDELPQLLNVLMGQMSLVGPRPHAVPHNQSFEDRIDLYARRHNVKPGITGWAQVNGLRGETDTEDKMRRRVEYDLYYIDNWSLAFDFRILWRTLVSREAYRNAY